MGDPEESQLRTGVRSILEASIRKTTTSAGAAEKALAAELEQACFDAGDSRALYVAHYDGLSKALPAAYGDFLEAPLATQLLDGRVAVAAAATAAVYEAHTQVEPRTRGVALFYQALSRDARFSEEQRRDFARRIERGCFNAAILRCTESADSYRRQWDSEMFVNVYSARVGLVSANIDPSGSVARGVEGGSWALDRLASGEWVPENLGAMAASELCPQAGKAVRDQVNHRLNQKIEVKTSTLFACPRCHKRNHTYRQVQIGAGDEPSTFMCTCKECGENYEGHA